MYSDAGEDFAIDKNKLNKIKIAVLQLEKKNVNTKEFNNAEMVDRISKTIITFADQTF